MVDSKLVRRSLILALALSVVGLGPVPLSACALHTSKLAECATPKTQSRCDRMNMVQTGPQLVRASESSCCSVSKPPIPELRLATSDFPQAAPIRLLDGTGNTPPFKHSLPIPTAPELSPPTLQSLLCTFLI